MFNINLIPQYLLEYKIQHYNKSALGMTGLRQELTVLTIPTKARTVVS